MRRSDYIQTDELIKDTYLEFIKTKKKIPTQEEVAEKCNITRKTVNLHLKRINLKALYTPYKVFGDKVLLSLYIKAMKGDVPAIKLFLALVFDYNEKHEIEGELKVKAEIKTLNAKEVIDKYGKTFDKLKEEEDH